MAERLETRLDRELEHVQISATLLRQGRDANADVRLDWMIARCLEAKKLVEKIEKRGRRAR